MPKVDRWVITRAFEFIAGQGGSYANPLLASADPSSASLYAVNLSGATLGSEGFCDYVVSEFERLGIAPSRVCFEITETAVIANLDQAHVFMQRLKRLGCLFSLDDFGSGLSSFGYLKSLPVDFLKIDGLFIRDLVANKVNQALVQAINQVGHVMGLKTVAEYVESEATLQMVKAFGVDYAQGYALGPARMLDTFPLTDAMTNNIAESTGLIDRCRPA